MGRTIDADALIARWIDDASHMVDPLAKMFTYGAINDVQREPTVVVPQWIPVSERLPEENMWTICQNNAGAMMIGKYDIEFGWMFPACFDGIVAWQPLPEPYKKG